MTYDEKHEIQFVLNLNDYTATQYVDDVEIAKYDFLEEDGNIENAINQMILKVKNADFDSLVSVDENILKEKMGLEIDDKGNFYDPFAKDLDNDGIIDMYDYNFIDSDYFESTYDVEDNIESKAEEKPSILAKIKEY